MQFYFVFRVNYHWYKKVTFLAMLRSRISLSLLEYPRPGVDPDPERGKNVSKVKKNELTSWNGKY